MTQFAQTLRSWRQARRFSQLDLSLEADVSARHISFLETGRAQPSRDMIRRLGEALTLPLSAQNTLMSHAGFAPKYPSRSWQDRDMAPIRAAINHTLEAHAPFPAMAVDAEWTVLQLNPPAARLYGFLGVAEGDSLLDLLTSGTLPHVVENWAEVAHHSVLRLRTESAAAGGIPQLDATADALTDAAAPSEGPAGAVVPMVLNLGDMRLSLFGTIAQFGTPEDVLLDEMKIELFFPADAPTRSLLENMA